MTKGTGHDPFLLDPKEATETKKENTMGSSGLICPKRNSDIKGDCGVCDVIQMDVYAKNYHKDHPARVWSSQKKAKSNSFLNVVLPSDPNRSYILEIGSKASSQIIEGMEQKGWNDIAHPHAGKGRIMMITKSKGEGSYMTYSVSPELQNVDWEIPEDVWRNVPDLDNVISMIEGNELNEENHIRISKIKEGETFKFRICPPWNHGKHDKKQRILKIVWRHWGVSPEMIGGTEPMNWREDVEAEKDGTKKGASSEEILKQEKQPEQPTSVKTPKCFGNSDFYDTKDPLCFENCESYKPCGVKVVAEDDIPF